jgi:hypothetical protein
MKKDKDESLSLIATGSSGGTFDRGAPGGVRIRLLFCRNR